MSLILALHCKDGIVMASDGAGVTPSSGGSIRHRMEKIYKIGDKTLFGASGSLSLVQNCLEIVRNHSSEFSKGLNQELTYKIVREILPISKSALEVYKLYYGNSETPPVAEILIATTDQEGAYRIWHIAKDCNSEFLDSLGYFCVGMGDVFAYTLLKNFDTKEMSLKQASLVAYKVIRDSIEVGAYALGEPIHVWALTKLGAACLSDVQIGKLQAAYSQVKKKEAQILSEINFSKM